MKDKSRCFLGSLTYMHRKTPNTVVLTAPLPLTFYCCNKESLRELNCKLNERLPRFARMRLLFSMLTMSNFPICVRVSHTHFFDIMVEGFHRDRIFTIISLWGLLDFVIIFLFFPWASVVGQGRGQCIFLTGRAMNLQTLLSKVDIKTKTTKF